MYSNTDFEKLWFLYTTEGHPKGISINSYCVQHGIPYKSFCDWLRKRQKKVVPVCVEGLPLEAASALVSSEESSSLASAAARVADVPKGSIMVTIQTRDGLHIRKCNLDYVGLKELVEKLEGLC